MGRSARKTTATTFLQRQIELGATGRVALGAGAASLDVFLLHGQVVAAQSPEDSRQLVRLSAMRGGLPPSAAEVLDARAERAEPVFGDLLDQVPAELIDQLLLDRFRQNLASYVGSVGKPTFSPLHGVFVDNLQIGHDTAALIDAAVRLWDLANTLDLDALLVKGAARLESKEQRLVAAKLTDTPQTVSSLLMQLPLEPLVARVVILDMLGSGSVQPAALASSPDDEDVDDAPTVQGRASEIARALNTPVPLPNRPSAPPTPVPPAAEPELELEPEGGSEPADLEVDEGEDPTEETPVVAMRSLTSLSAWLTAATRVEDDELDFFEDHDYERGKDEQGSFSTDLHNLDRVEVSGVSQEREAPVEEALEADEAPAARFSAPVLSEDEALDKITVANEVLSLVVRAFDDIEGSGRGRAVVQLLVDGSPSRFAELLHDVQVDDEGQLPDAQLLENLYGRPPTEHRQLINQTLVDIIERALSSAADELPDEQFDHVLESVAGYRQRLGL